MAIDKVLRGRCLSFLRAPQGVEDSGAYRYCEDGALWLQGGVIRAFDAFETVRAAAPANVEVIDHRPHLILPGLIDAHAHMPQMQVIASYGARLLDWLETYTFPEESRFADEAHARRIAGLFLDELLRQGTTTVAAFCTSHPISAEALFDQAAARAMRVVGGKVMMDRGAPAALLDDAQRGHDETLALIERRHGVGRNSVAITPRFALTSTPAQLEAAGALAARFPDCLVQTHLSENDAEIAAVARLFPDEPDYLAVYERFGLVGPKSLMGHAIHLAPRERASMRERGAVAVFCPTSNLFLGSGLYDFDLYGEEGLRRAIASDVGGGASHSMLQTMKGGYDALALRGQKFDALRAFHLATSGNAKALGLDHEIGDLQEGSAADLVVLDSKATPAMALRAERLRSLEDELFLLQILGDDRAVAATYVSGERR